MNILDELKGIINENGILCNEPMSRHTTFRAGGAADFFVMPENADEIKGIVRFADENNIPYYVIGNGSNLLVKDGGFRGIIIQLGKRFSAVKLEGEEITAQAGALLSAVSRAAMQAGLSGMEFAGGIPGSIGGGVCMNAGAYGGELKDIIIEVTALDKGKTKHLSCSQAGFRYRGSDIADNKMLVLDAKIKLNRGNRDEIFAKMQELSRARNEKQPVELPSAGSTFKRPVGYFAAKLIDDCGLRGFSVGQAQVSPKHCGFVVNNSNASATDILELMSEVQRIVMEKTGVKLEPEVKIIGE